MPIFLWEGTTASGAIQKGEIEAPDRITVENQLRARKITASKIKAKPKDLLENITFLQPKIKPKDVVIFTRQFATMIDAGLPLVQGLDILAQQQENKRFKKVLMEIKNNVEAGSTFADALAKHPKVFDSLFCNMIAAGEVGGILDNILLRLSTYMEKAERLKRKVKGAMVYPVVVVVIAVAVVAILLIFVIPVFQAMFEDFGGALPGPTQFVVNLSGFLKSYVVFILIAIGLLVWCFKRVYATKKGRRIVDGLILRSPVFGPLIQKVAVAKFSRTLGTMMSSGVPILEGLEITSKTAGNVVIEEAVMRVRSSISEGKTMAVPLADTGVFPGMVVQMISVGEATGALDAMLNKIADFYDEEVDVAVEALTSLLEPMLMVFLGGIIGGLVIAMYLPIFQMAAAIG
ncbi:MAG: type II secretion system F family protein [Deltaproteobacteria bacterium]|nr:type II secretion system F family protein [Deltaproteobacteria bacterium]